MIDSVVSVGLDIGTTTTQLVFSRLEVKNIAGTSSVPRVEVVSKAVIYRGAVHFTPLLSRAVIDAQEIRRLVEADYQQAGILPTEVKAGAVIITGETARKDNAQAVLKEISGLAGSFVVATAGSSLEAILAGRGSGAAKISKEQNLRVINFDVGGGTSNIAVFAQGKLSAVSCLDIGGRQIKVERGLITYVADKLKPCIQALNLPIAEGQPASLPALERLTQRMALFLDEISGLSPRSSELAALLTAQDLNCSVLPEAVMFSGGVADFVDSNAQATPFMYGDIGVLLGRAIRQTQLYQRLKVCPAQETLRATVIGAGLHSMEISGSTIGYSSLELLPMFNVPIVKLSAEEEADSANLARHIAQKIAWHLEEHSADELALALQGPFNPSFDQVQLLAKAIAEGSATARKKQYTLIVILENDLAKSLANSLKRLLPEQKTICLDSLSVENGDYIDIGLPLGGGRVLPVVIKTLVFGA